VGAPQGEWWEGRGKPEHAAGGAIVLGWECAKDTHDPHTVSRLRVTIEIVTEEMQEENRMDCDRRLVPTLAMSTRS
jgi:hypothetical protein